MPCIHRACRLRATGLLPPNKRDFLYLLQGDVSRHLNQGANLLSQLNQISSIEPEFFLSTRSISYGAVRTMTSMGTPRYTFSETGFTV